MAKNQVHAIFARALSGDQTIFGGPKVAAAHAGRLRSAQIDAIRSCTPWMMGACIVNAIVVAATMAGTPRFLLAAIWAGIVAATSATLALRWWRGRLSAAPVSISARAVRHAITNAAVYGVTWGCAPVLFYSGDGAASDLVITCVCAGMMCGGAIALATVPAAALLATLGLAVGVAIAFLHVGDGTHVLAGALLLSYSAVLIRGSISNANIFAARVIAHFEGEQQREVIGMLLCDFEENASDWLWEIDGEQRVVHASARLAALLRCVAEDIVGRPFSEVLAPGGDAFDDMKGHQRAEFLLRVNAGMAFRDLIVPVLVAGEQRLWSLTGKPIFAADGCLSGFRGVGADVTEAREAQQRIRHLARHDALTGLPNRLMLQERLQEALLRLKRSGNAFALLCLDLDFFKAANDTMGHAGGDSVLIEVASRVASLLGEHDSFARIGGDEFAVLLTNDVTPEIASSVAQGIVKVLSQPFGYSGMSVVIGASVGIAMAPSDGEQADTLLKNADLALYRTKENGRGAYHFFEAEMDAEARTRRQLEIDLRRALAHNEFRLHYQPIIDISSGRITGCEALLRWEHPLRGLLAPAEFIALAEETGLIIGMGEWVVHQACREAATWPRDMRIAVNLSAVQFRSPGLVSAISRALRESGLSAARLEVEVTESVLISESATARAILDTLRLIGVRIALDDFGTGYSSLSYLREMPFDKIKIDRSFIGDLMTRPDCAAIVHALIGLAGSLNMSITAEGVETDEQLAHLREKGCGEAQGFLIGRPVPAEGLVALMAGQYAAGAVQAAA